MKYEPALSHAMLSLKMETSFKTKKNYFSSVTGRFATKTYVPLNSKKQKLQMEFHFSIKIFIKVKEQVQQFQSLKHMYVFYFIQMSKQYIVHCKLGSNPFKYSITETYYRISFPKAIKRYTAKLM